MVPRPTDRPLYKFSTEVFLILCTEKKKGRQKKEKTGNPLHTLHGMNQGGSYAEKPGADDLERVTEADIMPAGFAGAGLPDDFADKLENSIENNTNFEVGKEAFVS